MVEKGCQNVRKVWCELLLASGCCLGWRDEKHYGLEFQLFCTISTNKSDYKLATKYISIRAIAPR